MYKQPGQEEFLFYMLYAGATMLSLIACSYLLFRRGNAFAPDITSSARLRRWTAALFASTTLSHVWYLPGVFLTSDDDIVLHDLVGGLLDYMTVIPLSIVIMLCMLQDSRRPLWLAWAMVTPLILGVAVCIAIRSYALLPMILTYLLLLSIGLLIYMVRAIRQYGRWLRDNYADLEHKEVRQSFVVMAFLLLISNIYEFGFEWPAYDYVVQVLGIVIVCYLLWRVETLSDLSIPIQSDKPIAVNDADEETDTTEDVEDNALLSIRYNIGPLLKQYCEDTQLYLQYDISLSQLATLIGINRSYLSKHFALQGMTYNAYINSLRIQHFINLYHETVETHQPVSAQQLAYQSGFRNYNTFNAAFKKIKGMTATEWMQRVKS
ncbi:MAG: AraC family transcriptional regulator [Prevotella sp.]|nr:AraC family transcriptional regulator [Prevotella sp.]